MENEKDNRDGLQPSDDRLNVGHADYGVTALPLYEGSVIDRLMEMIDSGEIPAEQEPTEEMADEIPPELPEVPVDADHIDMKIPRKKRFRLNIADVSSEEPALKLAEPVSSKPKPLNRLTAIKEKYQRLLIK